MSPRRVLAAVAALVVALFVLRTSTQPLQPYGSNSAEYIEHAVRLEVAQAWGDREGGVFAALVALDDVVVTHPAGLHLATSLLPGTTAEGVLWTGLLWLALLAVGLGLCGEALRPGSAAAAATAALLFPAALGAATRYHYDLPMTALLWLATGLLLHAGRRPVLAPLAGLAFAAACFVKWTALPFGAFLGLGALLAMRARLPRRALAAALCLAVFGALVGGYLGQASTSFEAGAMAVDTGDRGGDGGAAATVLLSLIDRVVEELSSPDPARWLWYPVATVVALLSPLGTLALIPPLAGWWRGGRPGASLAGAVVLGHLALLTFGLRVLDERFALTFVPALLLAGALGIEQLKPRLVLACVAALALVNVEFHASPAGPHNAAVAWTLGEVPITTRGPFLGDSFEQRGWAARATTEAPRRAAREQLWAALADCGVDRVGFVEGLDDHGDTWWLRYRTRLDQRRGRRRDDLLVLSHGRFGPLRYWWPDPDTELESHRHEQLGFSQDRLPEEALPDDLSDAEIDANLAALGFRRAALEHFRPTVALGRVPPSPDSPLDATWRVLTTIDAGEPVALYGRGPRPCRPTQRPPPPP